MHDHNKFKAGRRSYRWAHKNGDIILYVYHPAYDGRTAGREGQLRLERGEWVFTRGAFAPPWPTGSGVIREAKQIVQVRLAMEAAYDK